MGKTPAALVRDIEPLWVVSPEQARALCHKHRSTLTRARALSREMREALVRYGEPSVDSIVAAAHAHGRGASALLVAIAARVEFQGAYTATDVAAVRARIEPASHADVDAIARAMRPPGVPSTPPGYDAHVRLVSALVDVAGWRDADPRHVYVGPSSRWAPPSPAASCAEYEAHVRANAELVAALPTLVGCALGCTCRDAASCHARVLRALALKTIADRHA